MKEADRSIFGWLMYDFANQSYILTVAVAVLPAYFAGVVAGPEGWKAFGTVFSASTLWGYAVGISALITFFTAPVLGAAADRLGAKKKFLAAFCLTGCLITAGLGFCGPGDVIPALVLFIFAQALYAGGNVFYDGFIPELVPPEGMDRLSSRGFAFGYTGGAIHFILSLALIVLHEQVGLTKDQAARLVIVSAAVWWAGFFLFPLRLLKEQARPAPAGSSPGGLLRTGVSETLGTLRELAADRTLRFFLPAYLLYNDGVQTVIAMAAVYGKEELGLSETVLMSTLLAVQFVAVAGAVIFSRLAGRIGARTAVMVSLVIWCGVAVYASFIHTAGQYFAMGLMVGLVLGGTQALSRSMYASMIPEKSPARYFGFFSVVTKFSAVIGPMVFGTVRQVTGSSRPAVPMMALFFLSGLILLWIGRPRPDKGK